MIKNLKIYADTSLETMAELKKATEYERLDMEHTIFQHKKKYYDNRYNVQRNSKTRTVSIDSFMDICAKKNEVDGTISEIEYEMENLKAIHDQVIDTIINTNSNNEANNLNGVRNVLRLMEFSKENARYVICNREEIEMLMEKIVRKYLRRTNYMIVLSRNRNIFLREVKQLIRFTFSIPNQNCYTKAVHHMINTAEAEEIGRKFCNAFRANRKQNDFFEYSTCFFLNHLIKKECDNDSDKIYVYYKLENTCVVKKHKVETITKEVVDVRTGSLIKANVFHCMECDKCFINAEIVEKYIEESSFPGFNYVTDVNSTMELNNISKLKLYGYSASQNMQNLERQGILQRIIEAKLMTKAEIIRDLQFKVNYNGKREGNEAAKKKWEEDILFVSQYIQDNTETTFAEFVMR